MDDVTPNEIARSIGVTGLQFRNWLREQKVAGHSLIAGHEYRPRYRFTRAEADRLTAEFLSETPSGNFIRPVAMPSAATSSDPFAGLTLSDDSGHRVTELWMGQEAFTLTDLQKQPQHSIPLLITAAARASQHLASPSSFSAPDRPS